MKKLVAILALVAACRGASSPTTDPAEAGVAAVNDGCQFLEGVDSDGTVRTICAFVTEIASIVIPFILTLRTGDAGVASSHGACEPLPGRPDFCATSAERAKAILWLTRVRAVRLTIDGGAP